MSNRPAVSDFPDNASFGHTMTGQPYIHPAFPEPDDPSAVIWRYMDAPKFEWLVNCGRLFMPSADRLGDPLEGSTPPGDLVVAAGSRERCDRGNAPYYRIQSGFPFADGEGIPQPLLRRLLAYEPA